MITTVVFSQHGKIDAISAHKINLQLKQKASVDKATFFVNSVKRSRANPYRHGAVF